MRHTVPLDLRERLDVAARRVDAVEAADDDDAHIGILSERLDDGRDLAAAAIGNDIERGTIETEPADLLLGVHFVAQAIEVAQDGAPHFRIVLLHGVRSSLLA
jgi:hypothetical protein